MYIYFIENYYSKKLLTNKKNYNKINFNKQQISNLCVELQWELHQDKSVLTV